MNNKLFHILLTVLLVTPVVYGEDGSYRNGTVTAVDLDNNTFTVLDSGTGESFVYEFPDKVSFQSNGKYNLDKELIRPGVNIRLRFSDHAASSDEQVVTGEVLSIDRVARKGLLRLEHSNRIVPFRFSDELESTELPVTGDMVVFNYRKTAEEVAETAPVEMQQPLENMVALPDPVITATVETNEIMVTREMIEAGLDAFYERGREGESLDEVIRRVYKAMVQVSSR